MGRIKKRMEGKNPFKLRRRKLKDGRDSLYIDHYHEGKHHYEFLKLYLLPPSSEMNRRENNRVIRKAEELVRNKRIALIEKKRTDDSRKIKYLNEFIDLMVQEYKKEGKARYKHLETLNGNLRKFKDKIPLKELNENLCISYYNWLKNECYTSSQNHLTDMTIHVYFQKLGLILRKAYKNGLLATNVWQNMDKSYKTREPVIEKRFLSLRELEILESTPYNIYNDIRRAFLFSCYSGLRISDIRELKGDDIKKEDSCHFVSRVMIKTGKEIKIPLNKRAMSYLRYKTGFSDFMFKKLPCPTQLQYHLNKWGEKAGIKGRLNFHMARHTFATLLLTAGADIYTTSSLLGHSDIRMTQRYAKVIDKKKEEAIIMMEKMMKEGDIRD